MSVSAVPIESKVTLAKTRLQGLIDALLNAGYQVVGPQVADGAVVYDQLESIEQLPLGVLDEQDGGAYRLMRREEAGYFDHVVGPHSLKQYLFPPHETLQQLQLKESGWQVQQSSDAHQPLAVIGPRSCDLHAMAIQDRVFLDGPYVDPAYRARRDRLFVVSIQCRRAVATCFCHSMKTGPKAKRGFDLAITELDDCFVIEVGTIRGGEILADVNGWQASSVANVDRADKQSAQLEREMRQRESAGKSTGAPKPRELDTRDIRDLLLGNLNHPRWTEVAERCLSCANCTMVCPTCFCSSVTEVSDLTGQNVRRERSWTSCFTSEHSLLNSGVVRNSTKARYRQWLTHKLATWIDQYDTSGCVGCGRCITWCPVGIDLTEEVAAIRETAS
ncbi:MAG: 4Fe-4S dicluster domain-containing protein [Planctomycetaceae bacterium]|nr:4Fe-4S dicluster domain-containing protein [Planctomycetaceae bacterium]